MALDIKDGNNIAKTLKTTIESSEHIAHHIIDSVGSTVNVSASAANPVYVTGTVQISQPVNVDVVVGDSISVTSSVAAPLYISSSANSPILVTGTVNVNNLSTITTVTSSGGNPIQITGAVRITEPLPVEITVADIISVTSSLAAPLYISSSANSPLLVTGTVTVQGVDAAVSDGLRVTSSVDNPLWVSASFSNPVAVTGSFTTTVADGLRVTSSVTNPLAITGTVALNNNILVVTSSNSSPVLTIITSSINNPVWITGSVLPAVTATVNISATASVGATVTASIYGSPSISIQKNKFRVGDTISYSLSTSGTFELAQASTSRKGLIVHNPSSTKLYVVLGSGTLNGFTNVQNLQDEPNSYSFILYPSGTYIADLSLVNVFHGGWFVSSSNVDGTSVFVTVTE